MYMVIYIKQPFLPQCLKTIRELWTHAVSGTW